MHAITWKLGTSAKYDNLFEELRQQQYADQSHPLWKNYNLEHFVKECAAVSIAFRGNVPVLCSSVLKRSCWPQGVYRILNRAWGTGRRPGYIKNLVAETGPLLHSQINWIRENDPNYQMVFISRETSYWQKWSIDQLSHYGLDFKIDTHLYQVCDNVTDASCWQRIIYIGDHELLEQWNRKDV